MEYTLEQKFKALCQINRAAHFEWRATVIEMFPEADSKETVLKYWEIIGQDTAKAYLKKIDKDKPVAPQIAQAIVDSSIAMGEKARVVPGENEDETYIEHLECPWFEWHKKFDALAEDQPGCDCWMATIVKDINEALGTKVKFETLGSLPNGDTSCKRVFREK